jgi:hypothetical protein
MLLSMPFFFFGVTISSFHFFRDTWREIT